MSTRNHEMNKKIVKLTKVIYDLNIKNERYKEEIEVQNKRRKEEQDCVIRKVKDEVCKLRKQLEAKQALVEAITAKNYALVNENMAEKKRSKEQFEAHQDELNKIRDDFGKEIQEMKYGYERSVDTFRKSTFSLREELNVLQQNMKDKTKDHKTEIENLEVSHGQQIDSIIHKYDKDICSIQCKNDRAIEELKFSMDDDKRSNIDRLKSEYKRQKVELERKYKLTEKQMRKMHLYEIEVLKVDKGTAEVKLDEKCKELAKADELIKEKDNVIAAAELSLAQEIKSGMERAQEAYAQLTMIKAELRSKKDLLVSSEVNTRNLEEKIQQLASERDNLLLFPNLLEKAIEEKKQVERKMSEVLQSQDSYILQRDEAEAEKKKISIAMKKHGKYVESELCSLKSTCISVRRSSNDLRECMCRFIDDMTTISNQIRGAYEECKGSIIRKYMSTIKAITEEREILKLSHHNELLSLHGRIEHHKKDICTKEDQLKQEKGHFEVVIDQMRRHIERSKKKIKESEEMLLQKENELGRLGRIISELQAKIKVIESEASEQKKQEIYLKCKLKNITEEYEKSREEKGQLSDETECMRNSLENQVREKDEILEAMKYRHNVAMLNLKKKFEASQKVLKDEFGLREDNMKSDMEKKLLEKQDFYETRFKEIKEHHRQEIAQIEEKFNKEMEKKLLEKKQFESKYQSLSSKLVELHDDKSHMEGDFLDMKNKLSCLMKEVEVLNKNLKKVEVEKIQVESLVVEHIHMYGQSQEEIKKLEKELRHKTKMHKESKEQVHVQEADLNKQKQMFLSEREAKIRVQDQLNILRQELIGQSEMIIRLNEQVHDAKEELDVMDENNKHIIADILMKENLRNKTLSKKMKRTMLSKNSKLRLTSRDLEYSLFRLACRESRPEDIEKILRIESELCQCITREKKMKDEMAYYKNELRNREENYNSRFTNSYAQNTVGVVNVLNRRSSSVAFGKENGKPIHRSNQRKSVHKLQTHRNLPKL